MDPTGPVIFCMECDVKVKMIDLCQSDVTLASAYVITVMIDRQHDTQTRVHIIFSFIL